MRLEMNGNMVQGSVTETNHSNWIECQSLSWGLSLGSRQVRSPRFSELTINKNFDKASTEIFDRSIHNFEGKCEIHLVDPGDPGEIVFKYQLEEVKILNFSQSCTSATRMESISLSYTQITLISTESDATGIPRTPVIAAYDINEGQ